ncbi:MAG: photosystem I reaction center subunit XI [Nostoc sp.]|uniref:photosystem I reaction center subunit XI n=1 Tax=Nostoc sp. TaxID=1180 RepID=UPI002FF4BFB9
MSNTSEMAEVIKQYNEEDIIKPFKGDPQLGNLSTPINDSPLVRAFIENLPAYRKGLTPFMRGLEIGMAHGYLLVGPEVVVGPLRESAHGTNLSGLITSIYIALSACLGISIFAITTFQGNPRGAYNSYSKDLLRPLKTREEWSQLNGGIFVGAMGGAIFAYFLLENFDSLDAILRGAVNAS